MGGTPRILHLKTINEYELHQVGPNNFGRQNFSYYGEAAGEVQILRTATAP
jgi:hypothetical protein